MSVVRIPVTLNWPGSGAPGINVFHLRTTEDWDTAGHDLIVDDALDVLATFVDAVYDIVAPVGFTWSLGENVVDVASSEARDFTVRSGATASTDTPAPHALAVVVGWKTTLAARRGRGRTFLGPCRKGLIDTDGTIEPGNLANIRTHADTFVASSSSIAGGSFAVWGQEAAGVPGVNVARDITSANVRDVFAVLRSRRD